MKSNSSIEYSDATPAIRFSYDRLGRKKTVSDVLGTRSYDYDDDHLQLIGEQQQHGPVVATIKRRYDHLGRPAGISLDDEYAVDYRYDQTGRFAALDWTGNRHRGTTTYDYLAGSDLLAGYRSGTITVSYAYEAQRDLKTAVTNTSHDRELSRYEYHYDRLGRQINVATTGSAFTKPTFALYGYNDRNELTTAARYAGDDLTDQGVPLPERERFYDYDPIGNRTKALEGRNRYDYQTNPLNQYETITAPPDPSQPLELFYDQDGNLTEMKTAVAGTRYVFNGENRLIIVEPTRPQPGDSKLRFSYDYRGRRVLQTVSSFTNGAWHQTARTGFIYDDWNLIAELNLDDDRAVQYVWGLDLSTTLQGAGGIGGLLVRVADDDQQHYLYDANGNVGQLVDEAGTLVAAYEYDAYGNQVQIAGSNAAENPFRFSTKYYDALSGLYYYGYRFYSAELGRWISRDPLEEKGGLNYYSFLRNNSINDFDLLGYLGFFQGLWQGVVDLGGGIGHTGEVLYLGTKALFGSEGAWKELGQIQEDREAIVRLVYETFDGKDSVFEAHFKSIISEVLDHVPDCAKQCLLEQLISELEIAFVGRQTGNIGVNIIVQKVSQTIGSKAGGIFTSKIGAIRKVGGSLVLGATILGYQTLGIMDAMSDSARELNDKYPGGYERLRRNGNTQYF